MDVTFPTEIPLSGKQSSDYLQPSRDKLEFDEGPLQQSLSQRIWQEIDIRSPVRVIVCGLFGTILSTCWNFDFPSRAERLLWRIFSTLNLVTYLLFIILYLVYRHYLDKGMTWAQALTHKLISLLILFLFIVARIFVLVEMFISLRSVPEDVYKTVEWSNFAPHI